MRKFILFLIVFGLSILLALLAVNVIKAADDEWFVLGKNRLSQMNVKRIKTDGEFIYIGTAYKLNVYDTKNDKIIIVDLPDPYVTAISFDKKYLWIGTMQAGLVQISKDSWKIVRNWTKESTGGKLVDNWITDILVDGSQLWIATKKWGVVQFDTITGAFIKTYSILEGLADNAVNSLALDGQSIWAATDAGISVYDKSFDMWQSFTVQDGLPSDKTTSLAVDGEYIWIGTSSGLARLNKLENQIVTYGTKQGLPDDSIQALTLDGMYLWVGTFAGATRFDKIKNQWTSVTGLPEESVSDMAINGNYIWFGTEGGGAARFNKKIPEAQISPLTTYMTNPNKVEIIGTASSYKQIASFSLDYRSEVVDQYIKTGIETVKVPKVIGDTLGVWNIEALPNIPHYIRLTVQDRDGEMNVAMVPFIIDTIDPVIQVDEIPPSVNVPEITISGRYSELNLVRITVQRGKDLYSAEVDRRNKRFSCFLKLSPGPNILTVSAEDIAGRKTSVKQTVIYDPETDKPEIVLTPRTNANSVNFKITGTCRDYSLKTVVIQPGNINATLTPVENVLYTWTFECPVSLKDAENKFTVDAYDFLGRKSSAVISVFYAGGAPSITLNKPTSRTNKKDITVTGKWSDNNIREIVIDPGAIKASVNLQNRTFSALIKLQEGQNVVTATIYDKDNQMAIDTWEVFFSEADTKITLNLPFLYTSENKVPISGSFNEPNFKKILLQPCDKILSVSSNTFATVLTLNEGINKFSLDLQDKTGKITASKKFQIVCDTTPPEISEPTVPAVVGSSPVFITGSYKEDHLKQIVAEPAGIVAKVDTNTHTYSFNLPANPGVNQIKIKAIDMAGNETYKEISFTYKEGANIAFSEFNISDTNILKHIRYLNEEIARLRSSRQTSFVVRTSPVKPKSPKGRAVFFVPFDPAGTDTLYGLTQEYLGSRSYWPVVSALNDVPDYSLIVKRKKILFPTINLIRYLQELGLYSEPSRAINALAIAFNSIGTGRTIEEYKEYFVNFLIREGLLDRIPAGNSIRVGDSIFILTKNNLPDRKSIEKLLNSPGVKNVIVCRISGEVLYFEAL